MGFFFRKSFRLGPVRVTASSWRLGYSEVMPLLSVIDSHFSLPGIFWPPPLTPRACFTDSLFTARFFTLRVAPLFVAFFVTTFLLIALPPTLVIKS
jgi:hypothetical protein